MSIYESVLTKIRLWAVDTLVAHGAAAPAVALAERGSEPALYPTPPCLVLDWLSPGTMQGTPGRANTPTHTATFTQYVGTVEFVGFGQQTGDWLLILNALADGAKIDGCDLVPLGTVLDVSAPVASGIEQRYALELTVSYAVRLESDPAVATVAVSTNITTP